MSQLTNVEITQDDLQGSDNEDNFFTLQSNISYQLKNAFINAFDSHS